MCGRFALTKRASELQEDLAAERWDDAADYQPNFNIAPTQRSPILLGGEQREIRLMRWGLIPSWARDIAIGARMINARSETVTAKPAFRGLVRARRCVVVADGYYEWQRTGRGKAPHYITRPDRRLLLFAGLWDSWQSATGPALHTFTIMTRDAAPAIAAIHHRMPVILEPSELDRWLAAETAGDLPLSLAAKAMPAALSAHRVSTYVNAVRNNGPQCIAPVPPAEENAFGDLFANDPTIP